MRMVMKTTSYAVTHFVVAVSVAYALTGDWRVALGIGLVEPAVQTMAYAFHEKLWDRAEDPDANPDDTAFSSDHGEAPA